MREAWRDRGVRSATFATLLAAALIAPPSAADEGPAKPDAFGPIRFLAGTWEGRAEGQPGEGTVRRTYEFVLAGRYLHERNVSTYSPGPSNPGGETHEHWSFFSHDRSRKTLVLRQFHQEGFVNQYAWNAAASEGGRLVFDSERFENLDSRWTARETYEVKSPDEFVETFELGAPGDTLKVYSRNLFWRVKP